MTLSLLVSLAWSQDTADLSQEGWSGEVAPSVSSLEYIVGHGDKINVIVVGEPDLSATELVVSADGSVNLPIVGRVVVKGRSAQDIEGQLTRLLARTTWSLPKSVSRSSSSTPSGSKSWDW